MNQPTPTQEEKARTLDLMVDLFYTHGLEIHNLWAREHLQGSTEEPVVTRGFAISSYGHIIATYPDQTRLTAESLEEVFEELKDQND